MGPQAPYHEMWLITFKQDSSLDPTERTNGARKSRWVRSGRTSTKHGGTQTGLQTQTALGSGPDKPESQSN